MTALTLLGLGILSSGLLAITGVVLLAWAWHRRPRIRRRPNPPLQSP